MKGSLGSQDCTSGSLDGGERGREIQAEDFLPQPTIRVLTRLGEHISPGSVDPLGGLRMFDYFGSHVRAIFG